VINFRRKYKELTLKDRILYFLGLLFVIFSILTLIYVILLKVNFHTTKEYKINAPLDLTYIMVSNLYDIPQWAPHIKAPEGMDSCDLRRMDSYDFHSDEGGNCNITFLYREPYKHTKWALKWQDKIYYFDFHISYLNDTLTKMKIDVDFPITKKQALHCKETKDTVNARLDKMVGYIEDYLKKQRKFYSLEIKNDTIFRKRPYLFLRRKIKASEFLDDFTKMFPDVLIFGIKNRLLERGAKSVSVIEHCDNHYYEYSAGFPIDNKEVPYTRKYVVDSLPGGKYKTVLVTGDYTYHPWAFVDALDSLEKMGYSYDSHRPVVYEYLIGHSQYPDHPEKWKTNIYIPVNVLRAKQ